MIVAQEERRNVQIAAQGAARLFGLRLRQERRALGLTQAQLCDETGITAGQISLVERGRANPTIDTMIGLAEGVGLGVHDLVTPGGSDLSDSDPAQTLAGACGARGRSGG